MASSDVCGGGHSGHAGRGQHDVAHLRVRPLAPSVPNSGNPLPAKRAQRVTGHHQTHILQWLVSLISFTN